LRGRPENGIAMMEDGIRKEKEGMEMEMETKGKTGVT